MKEKENIITERLVIRNVSINDKEDLWKLWKTPENEKYMCDPVSSIEEIELICKSKELEQDFRKGLLRVAVLKDTNTVIGTCNFGFTQRDDEWGFGYSISPLYWNQGFATEIVKSIINFGKENGIKKFKTSCASENLASARVLQKCGMTFDHKSSFTQPILKVEYEEDYYILEI